MHPAPEQVEHGVCTHCARVKPLRPDGHVITHNLRTRQAERTRLRRCPGSRQPPREEVTHARRRLGLIPITAGGPAWAPPATQEEPA